MCMAMMRDPSEGVVEGKKEAGGVASHRLTDTTLLRRRRRLSTRMTGNGNTNGTGNENR